MANVCEKQSNCFLNNLFLMDKLLQQIKDLLGPQGALTGDDVRQRAIGFWNNAGIDAVAIVRPSTTEQVSAVLKLCNDAGQPVVAHGGLTNMVESSLTQSHELVLSLERMRAIEEVDIIGRTMTVQAGAILQSIQEAAAKHDLLVPLDLGARGSCTIGGNIATNAGGNKVIRYGMTRDMILGLEAVLADGTIVSSMNKMIKNNSGYDLKQLFIGAEGTLGVITRAVIRLQEAPQSQNTAIVAINTFEQVSQFLRLIDRALGGTLSAFEVMWNSFYTLMTTPPATSKPPLPQHYAYYVLVEALGSNQALDMERFVGAIEKATNEALIADAAVANSLSQSQAMWFIRDDVEQLRRFDPIFNFDISMQIKHMESYVEQLWKRVNAEFPNNKTFNWGHIADGNLHFTISVGDDSPKARQRLEQIAYEPLKDIEGSVSAEHGIGLEKKPYLHLTRGDAEIELMRALKKSLDPNGILNPGKIF